MFSKFSTLTFLILIFCVSFSYSSEKKSAENKEQIDTVNIKTYYTPTVTVTSSKAVENKSPVPFAEISRSEIERNYSLFDIVKYMSDLPSVISYSDNGNNIGYSYLTMRGFSQRRINVSVNGIPQNDPEDHNVYWIDMPDLTSSLESIQIQRGAGLATYGSGAIGGSINLITSNFITKKGVKLFGGSGWQEYGAGKGTYQPVMDKQSVEFSSGLNGNYAFYGRLSRINSTGYRDNSFANLNSYFLSAVRFDDNFSTQINIFGGPLNDGLAYTGLPKSYINDKELRRKNLAYFGYDSTGKELLYTAKRIPQEVEQFSQPHYELLNDWQISENFLFKSALFYYSGEGYFDYSGAGWTNAESFHLTGEYGFPNAADPVNPIIRSWVGNKHGGWLPGIVWNHDNGELTAGLEMRWHNSEHWAKLIFAENLPAGIDPDYKFLYYEGERDIYSAYAREQYYINEKLSILAEGQLVYNSYRLGNEKAGNKNTEYLTTGGEIAGNGNLLFNIEYLFFNPRFGAMYKIDNEMNIYGFAAITSQEPRMVNLYNASESFSGTAPLFEFDTLIDGTKRYNFEKPLVKPEQMLDIELGWKFKTNGYFLNINAYYMDYSDELVKSGQLDIFGNPIDGNATKTRHAGIELSGSANLFEIFDGMINVSGNATYSNNKIVEFDYLGSGGTNVSLNGNEIAGFPDFLGNIRLSYISLGLYISLTGKYVGGFRTDNYGNLINTNSIIINDLNDDGLYYSDNKTDAYTVFNLDLSYSFGELLFMKNLKLQANVNNLFNKLYAANGEGMNFFPAAERNIFIGCSIDF